MLQPPHTCWSMGKDSLALGWGHPRAPTSAGDQVQLAAAVNGHAEQGGLVPCQQLLPAPALRDEGHICHDDAMRLLHVVQPLKSTRRGGPRQPGPRVGWHWGCPCTPPCPAGHSLRSPAAHLQ